jgi:hypothetical protein
MNGIFSYIFKIAIISLIIFLSPVYSQTVLFDNLENFIPLKYTEDTDVAQQFTTTASLRFITAVELGIYRGSASGNFTVSIYADNGDEIGDFKADIYYNSDNSVLSEEPSSTFTINHTNDYNNCLPLELAGDTKYWIYVTSSEGVTFFWNYTSVLTGTGDGFLVNNFVEDTYYDSDPMLLKITANNVLPVELTTFTANLNENKVILNWQTATEVNNYGFDVETLRATSNKWEKIGFVEGHGNSNSPKDYSFTDTQTFEVFQNLEGFNGVIQYRLKQIDFDGNYEYSDEITVELGEIVKEYKLEQNYPNPFNPSTTIKYSIPQNTEYSPRRMLQTTLKVYDILGNEVATLVNERQKSGNYEVKFNASNLASGIYLYKLQSGSFAQTRKLMLIK